MPHQSDISMKNFSIVTARIAGALLAAGLAAAPALAADCKFRPNAPDQHKVVRGDTLWDISGRFLEHPWCWPQVWGMNRDEIRNPHWIYPGQIVYFDRARGRLSLQRPGADAGLPGITKMSPQVRSEGLEGDAVPSIPASVIEPFLTRPLVVDADALAGAPRIAATQEGKMYLGQGDKAYVKGELGGASAFQVYRPGTQLKDPVSGKVLGYEAQYLGTVRLEAAARPGVDVHTFTVSASVQEMGVGDRLAPAPPEPMRNYVPHAPATRVDARVMSVPGGVTYAGQNQVVTINRGSIDGLDVGSVLQLYHFGKVVADPGGDKGLLGMRRPTLRLPDEQYGSLFIFRVFKNVSYGLIMQVTQPAQVGDVAKSPE
jgi:hypothetical protein